MGFSVCPMRATAGCRLLLLSYPKKADISSYREVDAGSLVNLVNVLFETFRISYALFFLGSLLSSLFNFTGLMMATKIFHFINFILLKRFILTFLA